MKDRVLKPHSDTRPTSSGCSGFLSCRWDKALSRALDSWASKISVDEPGLSYHQVSRAELAAILEIIPHDIRFVVECRDNLGDVMAFEEVDDVLGDGTI